MHRDAITTTLNSGLTWGWWAWRAWRTGGNAAGGSGIQF